MTLVASAMPTAMVQIEPALSLSLVAQPHCAYVSETVEFCIRVQTQVAVAQAQVSLVLPSVFNFHQPAKTDGMRMQCFVLSDDSTEVRWTRTTACLANQTFFVCARAEVHQAYSPAFRAFLEAQRVQPDRERALHVPVSASGRDADSGSAFASARDQTRIAIRTMSRHASYLPSLYRQANNDLLGRYLMAGERHWQLLEGWLDHIEILADPLLAPLPVLAWLGTWADEPEDERWPQEQRRRLLNQIMQLRRWRGTRKALREHIALYAGIETKDIPSAIEITEHRASQLRVGTDARLGTRVVLGSDQVPHRFSVTVRLPAALAPSNPAERENARKRHEQVIRDIIESEKPAHTNLKKLDLDWASVGTQP
jgi:phage tail-like protein